MAYPTLTMRKIREVLRLHFDCGFRQREIARAVGASPTTVGQYVRRMARAGLTWAVSATILFADITTNGTPCSRQGHNFVRVVITPVSARPAGSA